MNFDISLIKSLVALIKLFQSLIKSLNLSILLIFCQIDFQFYNFILISPPNFNLCYLDPILKSFFIYFFINIFF